MGWVMSFFAGSLSTLSPCVLPILPIIVSSALQEKLKGLIALALGLALSFAVTGTLISYTALVWGFDPSVIRYISATLLLLFGAILISETLNARFIQYASRLTDRGNEKLAQFQPSGVQGQFVLGILLAMVWTPCVGPVMGAAMSMAMQANGLLPAFFTMLAFGIGAGIPMIAIGMLGNKLTQRHKIASSAQKAKKLMGYVLIAIALLVLLGFDKMMEAWLIELMPDWLLDLTTSI